MTVTLSHLPTPQGLTVTLTRDTHRARFTRHGVAFAYEEVDPSHLESDSTLLAWARRMMDLGYAVAQEIAS